MLFRSAKKNKDPREGATRTSNEDGLPRWDNVNGGRTSARGASMRCCAILSINWIEREREFFRCVKFDAGSEKRHGEAGDFIYDAVRRLA